MCSRYAHPLIGGLKRISHSSTHPPTYPRWRAWSWCRPASRTWAAPTNGPVATTPALGYVRLPFLLMTHPHTSSLLLFPLPPCIHPFIARIHLHPTHPPLSPYYVGMGQNQGQRRLHRAIRLLRRPLHPMVRPRQAKRKDSTLPPTQPTNQPTNTTYPIN